MVRFAESEHNKSMRVYEQRLREAKASNSEARASMWQSIEDSLVKGGIEAVIDYEKLMQERWEAASCLAEFDGVSMGFAIAKRARARVESQSNDK